MTKNNTEDNTGQNTEEGFNILKEASFWSVLCGLYFFIGGILELAGLALGALLGFSDVLIVMIEKVGPFITNRLGLLLVNGCFFGMLNFCLYYAVLWGLRRFFHRYPRFGRGRRARLLFYFVGIVAMSFLFGGMSSGQMELEVDADTAVGYERFSGVYAGIMVCIAFILSAIILVRRWRSGSGQDF